MSNNIELRHAGIDDLDIMLAWRSDPEIYEQFREQEEPLEWGSHVTWFANRSRERHDMIIEYRGRRVGVVNLDEDGYVGVYVGEKSLWGEGIGTEAVEMLCETIDQEEFYAEIRAENKGSQRLFEKCGFEKVNESDGWLEYRR